MEKFAARRAERGVRSQLVLFADSPHVKHYATYPEVYVSTVCDFMNDCLAEQTLPKNLSDEDDHEEQLQRLTKRIVMTSEATNAQ